MSTPEQLSRDARNRALRTFVVGLAVDIGVAIVLVLVTAFGKANGWSDLQWTLLGFTLSKTIVTTGGSYVLRRFLDGSAVPTPLPPAPVPVPNEEVPVAPEDPATDPAT